MLIAGDLRAFMFVDALGTKMLLGFRCRGVLYLSGSTFGALMLLFRCFRGLGAFRWLWYCSF